MGLNRIFPKPLRIVRVKDTVVFNCYRLGIGLNGSRRREDLVIIFGLDQG